MTGKDKARGGKSTWRTITDNPIRRRLCSTTLIITGRRRQMLELLPAAEADAGCGKRDDDAQDRVKIPAGQQHVAADSTTAPL